MRVAALVLVLLAVVAPVSAQAPQGHDGHEAENSQPARSQVGMDEKLGQYIPDDVVMADEQGRRVNVKQLVTMPTILVPVYYSCPNDCNFLLGALAQVLPQVSLTPGRDYQVVSVSFDDLDTPQTAARRKNDFITAIGPRFPAEHWTFLTADQANIDKLMDSVGFRFQREGQAFKHPVALIVLSPTGKVVRYLYGVTPMPFDINMAATEAAGETVSLSVKRAVAFCYTYDPAGRKYVFNFMRVAAVAILAGVALFAAFLFFGGKKRR